MSVDVQARVWKHSQAVGSARVIMLSLADRSDEHGISWPSYKDQATRANISRRQAIDIIKKLTEMGEIISIHGHIREDRQTSNRYFVVVGLEMEEIEKTLRTHPQLSWLTEKEIRRLLAEQKAKQGEGEAHFTPPSEAHFTPLVKPTSPPLVKPTSPEPSIEPSMNPQEESSYTNDFPKKEQKEPKDFLTLSAEIAEGQRKRKEPITTIAEQVERYLRTKIPTWKRAWDSKWEPPITQWLDVAGGDVDRVLEALQVICMDPENANWVANAITPASLDGVMMKRLSGGDSINVW